MKARLLIILYAAAWRLALRPLQAAAWFDRLWGRASGRPFLPAHWLAAKRFLDAAPEKPPKKPPKGPPEAETPPTLWMHAASLGESKGLWALAECLLEGLPPGEAAAFRILLTAQTASGLQFLEGKAAGWMEDRGAADLVGTTGSIGPAGPALVATLAPPDHPGLVDRFLRFHRVVHVVLFEADLWPHYILRAAACRIPVALVSARMTDEAYAGGRALQGVWSLLLDRMAWILAQAPQDAARFRTLTRTPVLDGFDFKARHYFKERSLPGRTTGTMQGTFPADPARFAFISLHLPELLALLPELPGLMARFPLTVFPRLPQEMGAFRKKLLPLGFALHGDHPGARHVLVDSLGKVGAILPGCGSAFVGGSLVPRGCHNLWEPLLAGLKVYFGPSTFCQEYLTRLALDRGVAEVLVAPSGMRNWREPAPGTAEACRTLMEEQVGVLEEGEAAFRARMADVISRFYLFSEQPGADERLPAV